MKRTAAILGHPCADAAESVIVQVSFGQPGVTRTGAALAAVDISPHSERIEGCIGEFAGACDAAQVEPPRQLPLMWVPIPRGGPPCSYLRVCRILIEMAEAFFSSSWRIL